MTMDQPKHKNEIVLDYEMAHARRGWVDLDATSNPDTYGTKTTTVNGASVPVQWAYLRAIGGNATVVMTNKLDLIAVGEQTRTLYDGFPEPVLVSDDELEVTSGTVRAYYADPFFTTQ